MRNPFIVVLFFLPLLAGAAEPSSPTPVFSDTAIIATIDGKQVTVGDFVNYYQKRVEQSQPDNRPSLATPAQAQQMLSDLLNARAILISAENDGYDKREEFIKAFTEFRDKTLLDEIVSRREKDLTVTQAEVEDFYQHLHREYHISLILLYDEKEAQSLMPKLRQPGADFAALARQYSRDPSAGETGGKLDEAIKYSPAQPWMTLFTLGKGAISDPLYIPEAYAWGIFRVDDITEVSNLPPLDKVRDELATELHSIKQQEIQEQIRNEALAKSTVQRDEALLNVLFTGDAAEWDKPGMAEKTVSTVVGQPIAFGELLKFIHANFRDPAQTRSDDPALFKQLLLIRLGQLEKEQAVVNMCLTEGLDREPAVAGKLAQFREKELVMEYLRDKVESKIPQPTEQQIANYYEAHKGDANFQVPEKIKATLLFSDEPDRLKEAHTRLEKGEDPRVVVDEINARIIKSGDYVIPKGVNPKLYQPIFIAEQTLDSGNKGVTELYKVIRAQQPGSWGGILQTYGMNYMGRLDLALPARAKTLEEAREGIIRQLEEQIQADPATNQLLAEEFGRIRSRYPVKVDGTVLEQARQKALATVPVESAGGK